MRLMMLTVVGCLYETLEFFCEKHYERIMCLSPAFNRLSR